MKTENEPSLDVRWMDKANLCKAGLWTIVFLGIIWAMAPWLDRPDEQPIRNSWLLAGHPLANHPMVGYERLASYPMWGYSILMRLFGSVMAVLMVQSFLGALATAALMVRLNCLVPRLKGVTTTLFVLALPWLSFMAYPYMMPMGSACMVLALLAVEMTLRTGRITWGVVAGVLFGFGQNFRSELLLLPGTVLVVVYILDKLHWFSCPHIKALGVCVVVATVFQMPWALNCYFNAGRFSLSESNFGHVVFLGLGKLPSNPWSIMPSDGFAQETVTKAGLRGSSLSFEGTDLLLTKFSEAVRQDPAAYAKCIAARIWSTVYSPFGYLGGTPAEQQAVRELVVGMIKPRVAQSAVRPREPTNNSASKVKMGFMVLYVLSQHVLSCAVSILGLIGLFLAMGKAPFPLSQPIILCLGIALVYRCGMNVALSDAGRYMTGVYLCYLPFAANTLHWFYQYRTSCKPVGCDSFS